jgi:hypothetical protein
LHCCVPSVPARQLHGTGSSAVCALAMSWRRRLVAASASFRSRSQRAREPDSGVSNPTRRYVCPLARIVSPSITEIDMALFDTGARVSISVCKKAATIRTAKAASTTKYLMLLRPVSENRLFRLKLMTFIRNVLQRHPLSMLSCECRCWRGVLPCLLHPESGHVHCN